jgi:hypothetical protein
LPANLDFAQVLIQQARALYAQDHFDLELKVEMNSEYFCRRILGLNDNRKKGLNEPIPQSRS